MKKDIKKKIRESKRIINNATDIYKARNFIKSPEVIQTDELNLYTPEKWKY